MIEPFRPPEIADLPIWDTLLQTRQPFVITHETVAQYMFRGTLEWQTQQQGHQTGINLLRLQDEPIGLLALVSTRRSFTPEELKLAQALAHQSILLEERNRMARKIHDTLAQGFTGIIVHLEGGASLCLGTAPRSARTLRPSHDCADRVW